MTISTRATPGCEGAMPVAMETVPFKRMLPSGLPLTPALPSSEFVVTVTSMELAPPTSGTLSMAAEPARRSATGVPAALNRTRRNA